VSIDLGTEPLLSDYWAQAKYLNNLCDYCSTFEWQRVLKGPMVEPAVRQAGYDPTGKTIVVRTSLASPWETVLGSVADKSAPVAYGMAALFAIRQLLSIVKEWQMHRLDVAERRQNLLRNDPSVVIDDYRLAQAGSLRHQFQDIPATDAEPAIANLETVLATEMIDPDDPRATG